MIRFLFIIVMLFSIGEVAGQEKVGLKDIYHEDFVVYKVVDNQVFTGIAQKVRNNGHLVYEEYYENGVYIKSIAYYNGKDVIPARVTLYHEKTFVPKTEIDYSLKKPIVEFTHRDLNGKITLNEIYTNDVLTYRCEYKNGKKEGIEYCLNDDGSETKIAYKNGKKMKLPY